MQSKKETCLDRRDALKAVALLASSPLAAQVPAPPLVVRRGQNFDADWKFLRGDAAGAEKVEFDDSKWRNLDLPHDFSVEDLPPRASDANGEGTLWGTSVLPTRIGPFDTELSGGGRDTGWFVGGTGWYRKHFSTGRLPADARVEIVFDGVYMNSDVWLNGTLLGNHPYGYAAFGYDLTPHLRPAGGNVLAVRVRNEGKTSRWYSGSGIYRHVQLNTTGSARVPLWGVFVFTPEVSAARATVKVAVRIENKATGPQNVAAHIRLLDAKGAVAGTRDVTAQSIAAGATAEIQEEITVNAPALWGMESPNLYRAEVDLRVNGKTTDAVVTPFGIRKVEVDADRGLRMNGQVVRLKGGCLHHDNGLLGACAIDRAEERRVELMKAHGFNAIRTSHNPPSSIFLDACDRLGMLVLDEAFDCWERQKNPQDYHLYFAEWWQRDLSSMVLRDRNHPSVILWSIGNEIAERAQPRGVEIAQQLTAHIKTLDTTRPVTAAINGDRGGATLDPAFQYLDVGGYNYMVAAYEADHARHPKRVILGTESFSRQAYPSWRPAEQTTYMIGDFVWTGMDHLGESSIGNAQLNTPGRGGGGGQTAAPQATPTAASGPLSVGAMMMSGGTISLPFPWFNCYCGDIDLTGQSKAQWFHRKVIWGMSKLEMAVQRPVPEGRTETISAWGWSDELRSWTWPGSEGKKLKVRVYSSGDQVRLFLNGKEVETKAVSPETELKVEFEVPYAAGELKAVALSNGQPIDELAFKTTGKPAKLRLVADRAAIRRNRNDLSYVTLEVLDQAGELVPDATVAVAFSISGAGELAAAGSANPKDVQSFRRSRPKTFHGKCLAIVRPTGGAGAATVRAEAAGLAPASIVVQVS